MKLVICSILYKPIFGNGTSFDTFVTIINVLVFVIYAIIIGFIATVILDFLKKDKKVISIISTSLAIIINLAFIIFSFVINNEIAKEGLSDCGGFSATIIPYLITLLSIGVLVLNAKNTKRKNLSKQKIEIPRVPKMTKKDWKIVIVLLSILFITLVVRTVFVITSFF